MFVMLNKIFRKSIYLIALTASVTQSRSDKALDVEPRDRLTDENVWTDPGASDLFLNDIYTGLPDGNNWYDPIENWSDNSICGFAWPTSRGLIQQSLQSPSNSNISGDIGGPYDWTTL